MSNFDSIREKHRISPIQSNDDQIEEEEEEEEEESVLHDVVDDIVLDGEIVCGLNVNGSIVGFVNRTGSDV